jgi:hypothetical protein
MTCPSHSFLFDHPKKFVDQYRSSGSSTCRLLQSPFTLSLLGQNFLPCNLFLYTLSLCFCLKKISIWRKISKIGNWNSKERGVLRVSVSAERLVVELGETSIPSGQSSFAIKHVYSSTNRNAAE